MEILSLTNKQIINIKKLKNQLEKHLGITLKIKDDFVEILCEEEDAVEEYNISRVMKAINLGFGIETALLLKDAGYMLELINLKDYARASRLREVKARIIGTKGKVLKTLSTLSNCVIKLSDNTVAIIGRAEGIKYIEKALKSLIRGSRHSKVYYSLEKKPLYQDEVYLEELDKKRE